MFIRWPQVCKGMGDESQREIAGINTPRDGKPTVHLPKKDVVKLTAACRPLIPPPSRRIAAKFPLSIEVLSNSV